MIRRPPHIEKLMAEMFPQEEKTKRRRSTQPKFAANLRPETKIDTPSRWKISINTKKKGQNGTPTEDAIRRHLGLSRTKGERKDKKSTGKRNKGVPRFMRNTKSREFALRSPRSPRSLRDPNIQIAKRMSFTLSLRNERLSTEKRAIASRIANVIQARGRIFGRTPQSIAETFRAMDRNGDHILSLEEFQEGMKRLDLGFSRDQVLELLEDFDIDRSNSIDLDEFLNALENPSREEPSFHGVYDAELQAVGKYRITGGRPVYVGSDNLHLLEAPDIKVPDLWKNGLRDYSPQNELLRVENEKRKEKRSRQRVHSPLPVPRVATPTKIDRKEEKDSDIESTSSPVTILVRKKPDNELAKKIHSQPLATYKKFWSKTLRPSMQMTRAKRLAFKPCSPVVKSSIEMTPALTKKTLRVLRNVSRRVYRSIRKESCRNHLKVLLQRMHESTKKDPLLFEDFVFLIRRICDVKDQEVDVLRRLVQHDGGVLSLSGKKTLNYSTLRDRLLSCLDELYLNGADDVDEFENGIIDEVDQKQSNGVHVHINRRGSIEIEGGHVVNSGVTSKSSSISPRSRKKGFISKLEAAKELHESGLITSNDYASVKNQILSAMMSFDVTIKDDNDSSSSSGRRRTSTIHNI